MATVDDVDRLRRLTDTPLDDDLYTGDLLATFIDNLGSVEAAAAAVWTEKASATAGLVSISESGSSRSLGDLHNQALTMAKHFIDVTDTTQPGQGSFTVGVERV